MCLPSRTARPESLNRLPRRSSPPRPVASQPATSSEPRPGSTGFEACADKVRSARLVRVRSSVKAMSCSERSSGSTTSSAACNALSARCNDPLAERSGQAALARSSAGLTRPVGGSPTSARRLWHSRTSAAPRRWPELLVIDRDRPHALGTDPGQLGGGERAANLGRGRFVRTAGEQEGCDNSGQRETGHRHVRVLPQCSASLRPPRRGSGSWSRAAGRRRGRRGRPGSRPGSRAQSPPGCRRRCRDRTGP